MVKKHLQHHREIRGNQSTINGRTPVCQIEGLHEQMVVSPQPFLAIHSRLSNLDRGLIVSVSYEEIDLLGDAGYAGHQLTQEFNPVRAV